MLYIKEAKHIKDKILSLKFVEYNGFVIIFEYKGVFEVNMQTYIDSINFKLAKELNDSKKFADFSSDHGVIT